MQLFVQREKGKRKGKNANPFAPCKEMSKAREREGEVGGEVWGKIGSFNHSSSIEKYNHNHTLTFRKTDVTISL